MMMMMMMMIDDGDDDDDDEYNGDFDDLTAFYDNINHQNDSYSNFILEDSEPV